MRCSSFGRRLMSRKRPAQVFSTTSHQPKVLSLEERERNCTCECGGRPSFSSPSTSHWWPPVTLAIRFGQRGNDVLSHSPENRRTSPNQRQTPRRALLMRDAVPV